MIQKVRKKKGRVPKANGRPKTNDPRVNLTFSVFSSVIGVVKASELDPESYRKIKIVAENAIVQANGRPKTNDPRVNLTFSVFSSVIGVVKASELDPESYRKIKIVAENAIVQAIEDGTVKIDVHSGKEAE